MWARDFGCIAETGKPPDLSDRHYQSELYDVEARESVYRKANQVGATALFLQRAVWGGTFHWPKGIAYWLPHDKQVGDLVRQKLNPILDKLPMDFAPTSTDNLGMKALARGDMFIRGIASEDARQGFSCDCSIFDERDLMLQEQVDDAMQRMEDSKLKITVELGRPSTPGYGIDGRFESSTQNFYTFTCPGCNHEWAFEESFPECLKGDPLQRVCPKCGKPVNLQSGRWIARKQSDLVGYTINGLLNPNADLKKMMQRYENKRGIFMRANMGMPWIEEGAGVRMGALLKMCGEKERAETHPGPTFMGSDVGDEGHTVILAPGKPYPTLVTAFRWKEWSELDAAMKKYHVGTGVVDALPEKRNARDFCQRWNSRAFMCFYDRNKRGAAKWDERNRTLNIDRTESLDSSHTPLYTGNIILPREDSEMRVFAKQCENEVRIVDELPDGNLIARWDKRGANHYRHAFNYGWAAMTKRQFKTITA